MNGPGRRSAHPCTRDNMDKRYNCSIDFSCADYAEPQASILQLPDKMNFEQLVTKYSQVSGRNQAESTTAVTSFIQILTDAIKEEEDIFTPTMTMKTRRTSPKPSPEGKERKPKTIGKIVIK